jgi:AcrR family transcriptional regulator
MVSTAGLRTADEGRHLPPSRCSPPLLEVKGGGPIPAAIPGNGRPALTTACAAEPAFDLHLHTSYSFERRMQMATVVTPPPPRTGRRQRKQDQTADHLSATAYRLFEAHGYDAVSMEQVADVADVAKATLYKYFPVKEALIAHRFRLDIAAGMAARAPALLAQQTFESRMRNLLRESAAWHSERRAYLPHYIRYLTSARRLEERNPAAVNASSDGRQILAAMFRAAQQSGEIKAEPAAEQLAMNFEYLLFAAITAWLAEPETDLVQRFLSAFELVMYGVASARGAAAS